MPKNPGNDQNTWKACQQKLELSLIVMSVTLLTTVWLQ